MAASWFTSKVNLSTIVSQGLEHVNKLKDDVEKQFDEAVSGKSAPKTPSIPSSLPLPIPIPAFGERSLVPNTNSNAEIALAAVPAPAPSIETGEAEAPGSATKGAEVLGASDVSNEQGKSSGEESKIVEKQPIEDDTAASKQDGHVLTTQDAPSGHTEEESAPQSNTIDAQSGHDVDDTNATQSFDGDAEAPGAFPSDLKEKDAESTAHDEEAKTPEVHEPLENKTTEETPAESDGVQAESAWASMDEISPDTNTNAKLLEIVKSLPPVEPASTSETPVESETQPQVEAESTKAPVTDTPSQEQPVDVKPSLDTTEVAFLQRELAHVQNELRKSQAMLAERENQLLASSTSMAKLHTELESLRNRPNDTSVIYQLQVALADKEMQLANLLEEGEALSKKQAAFESRLRALRKEKTDAMEENSRLTAALETAQAKWETARKHLLAAEDEAKAHLQVMKTLEATESRLQTTEAALDAAKKALAVVDSQMRDTREENDKLKKQTQAAAFEDREVLEATIRDLQASLQTLQSEAARREESARNEMYTMKQRYQEALMRMDQLTQSTSLATQPLLRQIQQLQEEHRVQELRRQELELDAQKRVDQALHKVQEQERLRSDDKRLVEQLQGRVSTLQAEIEQVHTLKSEHDAELSAMRKQLDVEGVQRQQLEQQVKVMMEEKRQAAQLIRANQEQYDKQLKQVQAQRDQLLQQVQDLQRQVNESTTNAPTPARVSEAPVTASATIPLPQEGVPLGNVQETGPVDSMIEWHQLHQRVRLRESESALLKEQLRTLEEARKHANDELIQLTTRNAELESVAEELATTKTALQAMEVKQQVLLELLGEKDEQVEELETEFREFKQMYQNQIDALTRR